MRSLATRESRRSMVTLARYVWPYFCVFARAQAYSMNGLWQSKTASVATNYSVCAPLYASEPDECSKQYPSLGGAFLRSNAEFCFRILFLHSVSDSIAPVLPAPSSTAKLPSRSIVPKVAVTSRTTRSHLPQSESHLDH